jgi:phosphonate degradation associated HDIG domain protein
LFEKLIHARSADECVRELAAILTVRGVTRHEEEVDHLQHALQSAFEAQVAGGDEAAVVAALLHDLGHLVTDERIGAADFLGRDLHHEEVGARLLAGWFPPEVTEPIRLHVAAKRYLCAVEPGYIDGLSAVSRRSLELQGGPMRPEEVDAFTARPQASRAVALRRADDRAKVGGRAIPPLSAWLPALRALAGRR